MANDKKEKVEDSPLVMAALGGGTANSEIQQQLAALLLKRLSKQDAEEEEALRLRAAARKAGMDAQVAGRAQELLKQENCAHKKPYGESAIIGQRLHSHKYQWLCQYCSKEWIGNDLPSHLRIDGQLVGGPNS